MNATEVALNARDFRYVEVDVGFLGSRYGLSSLLTAGLIELGVVLLLFLGPLLIDVPLLGTPPSPPPPPLLRGAKVIWIVGRAAPSGLTTRPKMTIPPKHIPKTLPPAETGSEMPPGRRAEVTIQFVKDPEQHLERVLRLFAGRLGFGDTRLVRQVYDLRGSGWERDSDIPPEGLPIEDFYALKIDERAGRYSFLDHLRGRYSALSALTAYAMFPLDVQIRLEDGIRREAASRCSPGDDLEATIRLQAAYGFQVQRIDCIPPKRKKE